MKLNNETIRTAVKEWLENSKEAEEKYGHISNWNVSNVTEMEKLFYQLESFNEDIGNWDVSNVTNMTRLFMYAKSFNQDISNWDVSNVIDMKLMFSNTETFNQDIGKWDVSNVIDMSYMFSEAKSFNQDIIKWNVSNVTNMTGMFSNTETFNQDISKWDVSNVTNMSQMFENTSNFNQDISIWNISNVTNMNRMFSKTESFNQDISKWDVSNVTNMSQMFENTSNFNQDISNWDVSKVTNMEMMFCNAKLFNCNLINWNIKNVKKHTFIFTASDSFDIKNYCPFNNQYKTNEISNTDGNIEGDINSFFEDYFKDCFYDVDESIKQYNILIKIIEVSKRKEFSRFESGFSKNEVEEFFPKFIANKLAIKKEAEEMKKNNSIFNDIDDDEMISNYEAMLNRFDEHESELKAMKNLKNELLQNLNVKEDFHFYIDMNLDEGFLDWGFSFFDSISRNFVSKEVDEDLIDFYEDLCWKIQGPNTNEKHLSSTFTFYYYRKKLTVELEHEIDGEYIMPDFELISKYEITNNGLIDLKEVAISNED